MTGGGTASDGRYRDISFHPIEGGAILFDALRRRLYALNPAAGLTWLCLRDRLSEQQTIGAIAEGLGIDLELAGEWYRSSTGIFHKHALLDPDATHVPLPSSEDRGAHRAPPERPGETLHFEILDHAISISADASLQADVVSLLGLLRPESNAKAAGATKRLRIDITATEDSRWEIVVDDHVEATCDTASVVAELERVLVESVVPATPHVLTFHAASLQHAGRTILLAGPSGSGKTTFSAALGHAGWAFGGDEIVLMERGARFRPLTLPPCIKEATFPVVSNWFPVLHDVPSHQRYGRTIKFLPIGFSSFETLPGVVVVFPTFTEGAEAAITRIDRFEGLQKLLAQCVFVPNDFSHSDVNELQKFQDTVEYYLVTYGSCDKAMELLENQLVA